jgi:hypothetical protein
MATSQTAAFAGSTAEAMDKIFDIFPEHASDSATPVLIDSECFLADMGKLFVITSRRSPFEGNENWMVECRINKVR